MTTFPRQAGHPLLSLSLPSFLVQRYPHIGHFHAYSLFIRSSKLSGTPFCSESHIALSLSSSQTASLMLSNGKSQRRSFSICASLNSPFPRCLFRLCIKLPCSLAVIGLSVWHLFSRFSFAPSFLPWDGSGAVPLAVICNYSYAAYQHTPQRETPRLLHGTRVIRGEQPLI